MSDVVQAALIGAAASIIVNLIAAIGKSKKRAVDDAVKEERLENRLCGIERKLDLHTAYAEKFACITIDIAVIKNALQNLKEKQGGA